MKTELRSLTDGYVADLPVTGKKYEERDAKVPGFRVRVEASGLKTYYFTYSFAGRTRFYRIGPAAMGATEARIRAKKLLGAVADGRDPQAERTTKRGELTFELLQQLYLEQHAKKHNKSWRQGDYLIRSFVLDRLGKRKAADISIDDVSQLFYSIKAPQTANQTKAAISAVYKFAVKRRIVPLNPCKGIDDNPTNERDRILSPEEFPLFWAGCDQVDPVRAAALRVIVLTGARPGEVSHMRYEHIKGEWWEMPGDPVPELSWPGLKNKSSHRIYLAPAVRELIGSGDAGFVFANTRGGAIDGLDAAMRKISKAQKLTPAVRPHDLRRSFGSMVTGRGHGREAMDRLLNHRKKSVTDVYDRFEYAEKDKAITADVAAAFMRLVEGRKDDNVVAIQPGQRSAG